MLFFYRSLTFLFFPLFIGLIYFRKIINKEHKERYKEKIFSSSFKSNRNVLKKLYWFHAASIGETLSIIPLIKKLNENNQDLDFLITTVTLSSSNLLEKELKNFKNINHRFFPLDSNHLVKKFLELWKPNLVCFVDSEIWPNFLIEIKKRKIPLVLVNGRITEKTFKKWKKFQNFSKKVFNSFDLCLTSNLETQENLKNLQVKNIKNLGNLKFCVNSNTVNFSNDDLVTLGKYKTWCAASTHEGEELLCLKTHLEVKKKFKNLLTIIVPRHIHRVNDIKKLSDKLKLKSQVLNTDEKIKSNIEVLIINSFGSLQKYFSYCKNVFIGKSLIKELEHVGGQNPIEAAKKGCTVFHGPFVYNFNEIYNLLKSYDISIQVKNTEELTSKLLFFLDHKRELDNKKIEELDLYGFKVLNNTVSEIENILKK
tara:strand:+ start:37 stop:1311 length:1275 start_codon:yes stop_codon:yes gene_type:complete